MGTDSIQLIDDYLGGAWWVKENSNIDFSAMALNNRISEAAIKEYWLTKVYPEKIRRGYKRRLFHIHNLGFITPYCYDDKTKVLTINGWKYFKDVTLDDEVGTYNLKTKMLEYQKPVDKQVFKYDGEMYKFKAQNISLVVTPEHRTLVRERYKTEWKFTTPDKFKRRTEFLKQVSWEGCEPECFEVPRLTGGNRLRHVGKIPIETFLKFMGWYISEGSVWIPEPGDYVVSIAQTNKENRIEIANIISELGFSPNTSGEFNIQFYSKEILHYLLPLGTSGVKYIPSFIKSLSPRLLEVFIHTLFKGDGHFKNNVMYSYKTKSLRLAEDVTECLMKIGKCGTISPVAGNMYYVGVVHNHLTPIYKELPTKIHYSGLIYDLTVPNTTLVVMREGRPVISGNCVGWNIEDILMKGFKGQPGRQTSGPAKHFRTALGHVYNFMYTLQGESAGAQALSNFDTYLAPFIAEDRLDQRGVDQAIQEFLFNMNVPTRVGGQQPFTNITLDQHIPKFMEDDFTIIGGKYTGDTYGGFQKEQTMLNNAWWKCRIAGDYLGRPQPFPIETLNVTKDFDWENELLMKAVTKRGSPYFSNFINSDMKPEDVRSMCCRLRIDNSELLKRGGGFFGANPLTGSIGVVTMNLPLIGYLSRSEDTFFDILRYSLELGKQSLELKREKLEELTKAKLYPYSMVYLESVFKRFDEYWKNHFSTLGLIGMNEACMNLIGVNIVEKEGLKLAVRILEFFRGMAKEFQEETDNMYNVEATPAEGTAYRLAMEDRKTYPDIITAGNEEAPYYTNSSQFPNDIDAPLGYQLAHQDRLQKLYTGGTVFHLWNGESAPHPVGTAKLLERVLSTTELPYITYTPTTSICPKCGFMFGEHFICPDCGSECEVWSRITGYFSPIHQWNKGKKKEFTERPHFL